MNDIEKLQRALRQLLADILEAVGIPSLTQRISRWLS